MALFWENTDNLWLVYQVWSLKGSKYSSTHHKTQKKEGTLFYFAHSHQWYGAEEEKVRKRRG